MKQLRQANERIDTLDKKIAENAIETANNFDTIRQQGHLVQGQIISLHTEIGGITNSLTSLSTDVAVKSGEQNMKIVDI